MARCGPWRQCTRKPPCPNDCGSFVYRIYASEGMGYDVYRCMECGEEMDALCEECP